MASSRARDINVMLQDLGYLRGKPTAHYGNATRTAMSLLQLDMREHGAYTGVPHGRFDDATRAALLADDAIPTTED